MIFQKEHFDKYCNGQDYISTLNEHFVGYKKFCRIYSVVLGLCEQDAALWLQQKKILDAGCAMGHVVKDLADNFIDACGYDASQYAIDNKVTDLVCYGDNDVCLRNYDNNSFDIVFTNSFQYAESEYQLDLWIQHVGRICCHSVLFVSLVKDHIEQMVNNFDQILQTKAWWNRKFFRYGFRRSRWIGRSICVYLK